MKNGGVEKSVCESTYCPYPVLATPSSTAGHRIARTDKNTQPVDANRAELFPNCVRCLYIWASTAAIPSAGVLHLAGTSQQAASALRPLSRAQVRTAE